MALMTPEERMRANRAQAERNRLSARQPIGNTTPAGQPVGASSSLTGTGREVQKRANLERQQVNRQKRMMRLLDRRARRGDARAAQTAFGLGEAYGPVSNITGAGEMEARARRALTDEAEQRRLLRAGTQQSPGAQFQDGPFRPQQSPGAQNVPPADATQDSGTNGAASSTMREVPESSVATVPVETRELPQTAEEVSTTNLPPDPFETAATEVGFDPEMLQGAGPQPDLSDPMQSAMQRAQSELGVIMSGTVPMVRRDGKFVELPGGYDALQQRANINRMEDRLSEAEASGFDDLISGFREREAQRAQLMRTGTAAVDGVRPTAEPVAPDPVMGAGISAPSVAPVALPSSLETGPGTGPLALPSPSFGDFGALTGTPGMSMTEAGMRAGSDERQAREDDEWSIRWVRSKPWLEGRLAGGRAGIAAKKFVDFNRRAIAQGAREVGQAAQQGAREVGQASQEALRLAGRGLDYSQSFGKSFREEFFGDGVSTRILPERYRNLNRPIPGTKTTAAAGTTPLAARTR